MNIFYLHKNPIKCANMHCIKHIVKMITESTQLLSTAHFINDNNNSYTPPYLPFNPKHPSCIWTSYSKSNYIWLCKMSLQLCRLYTKLYGKTHKCEQYIIELSKNIPNFDKNDFIPVIQAMPDDVRHENSIIAYRQYYLKYKKDFAKWVTAKGNSIPVPEWYQKNNVMIDL